jgi:hypothetical protein
VILQNARQVEVTRQKLGMLEGQYEATRMKDGIADHVRELTLRSLRKLINQFKEDIVRFESHAALHERWSGAADSCGGEVCGGMLEERTAMRPDDIREFLQRKPFQPLRITVADGRCFEVRQRELVMLGRASMVVGIPAPGETEPIFDRQVLLSLSDVVKMEPLGTMQ